MGVKNKKKRFSIDETVEIARENFARKIADYDYSMFAADIDNNRVVHNIIVTPGSQVVEVHIFRPAKSDADRSDEILYSVIKIDRVSGECVSVEIFNLPERTSLDDVIVIL